MIKNTRFHTTKITLVATAFLILLSFSGNAQIDKGYYLLGGRAGAAFSSPQTVLGNVQFGSFSWNLNPQVGVFVKDKIAIGANLTLAQSYSSNSRSSAIGIGPFGRYYFLPTEREVNLLAQAGFALGTNISNTIRQDRYSANLSFGPSFFLNRSIAFETTLNYNYVSVNSFGSGRFSLNFGFQIHFNPKLPVPPVE